MSATPAAPPTEARPHGSRHPRVRVLLLTTLLAVLAASVYVLFVDGTAGPHSVALAKWAALAAGVAVAEACVLHVAVGRHTHAFGFAEVPLVVGLYYFPAPALLTAVSFGSLVALLLVRRNAPLKAVFNVAQYVLGATCALAVWRAFGIGHVDAATAPLAALAATATAGAVSAASVNAVMALVGKRPEFPALTRTFVTGLITAVVNTAFAVVAIVMVHADWRAVWTLVVVAGFLALAQHSHIQLQKRHGALQRLNELAGRLGRDLHIGVVAEEIVVGASRTVDGAVAELEFADLPRPQRIRSDGDTVERLDLAEPGLHQNTHPRRRWRRAERTLRVPLEAQGRLLGHLTISAAAPGVGFGADDRDLVNAIAHHSSIALTNGRLADELRAQLAENEHQATHDMLTELPNRLMFERVVTAMLGNGRPLAVLLLDLDRFKEVNDTLGHAAGDALLRDAGERLRGAVPQALCIARLGGDEFTVLLTDADAATATTAAEAAREALLNPLEVNSVPVSVDASIGIALAPDHGTTCDDLLRHADVAMYAAKEGRGAAVVYDAELDHNDASRLGLAAELREAVASGGLHVNYQPKLSLLGTGRTASVEALARWNHPVRGFVPPDEFIAVAEQTGSIIPLTDAVLTTALRQCRSWLDAGLDMAVAVNVSPRVLRDQTFPDRLAALLAAHRVPAARLTLEITESAIMDDVEHSVDILWQLRKSGVRLSIDDLGIGQSSLAYLKRLPVHEVKIDKSFVFNMADDPDDDAIVCAVVGLAHRLRMSIVAEGVETQRTRDRLVEIGCDVAQGYWFSRPLPPEDVAPWFAGYFDTLDRQPRLRMAPGTPAAEVAAADA